MTFTRGREVFWPLKFHSVEVGPFSVSLNPRANESYAELADRAYELLEELFAQEFERTIERYLDRVIESSDKAKYHKGT